MNDNINSRILINADPFFAWDFLTYLLLAAILMFAIVLFDVIFISKNKINSNAKDNKKLKLKNFVYFLFFLKFSKNESYKNSSKIVQFCRDYFPIILFVLIFRAFFFEPFRVPSNSMMPTLLTGDFIIVNKFSYDLRAPITNTKIISFFSPSRGDVVVFRYPNYERNKKYSNANFIKRIVALPGDKISYKNDRLIVNGNDSSYNEIGYYQGVNSGIDMTGYIETQETIHKNNHNILINSDEYSLGFPQIIVPEGHYFVMGDNRSKSADSRYWGFVPESYVIGKAVAVWLHWDFNYNSFNISRIGSID